MKQKTDRTLDELRRNYTVDDTEELMTITYEDTSIENVTNFILIGHHRKRWQISMVQFIHVSDLNAQKRYPRDSFSLHAVQYYGKV